MKITMVAIVVLLVLLFFAVAVKGGKTVGWNARPLINLEEDWIIFSIPIFVIIISLVTFNWSIKLSEATFEFDNGKFYLTVDGKPKIFETNAVTNLALEDNNVILKTINRTYKLGFVYDHQIDTFKNFLRTYNSELESR
ncbi:hypothetical protein [Fulvivirga aurantia]|uniref:hypothetical protein n=1 Tax=Fulvivirga aurantia TaxID=2529383 RepID=UPI0012BBFC54|nr:hypothetical protein [Fulvivirga aurantia]